MKNKTRILLFLCMIPLLLGFQKENANTKETFLSSIEKEVLDVVNEERAKEGLPMLMLDVHLCEAADIRAEEITNLFSHTRPDGSEWWTVDIERAYGENLAKNYETAEEAMNGWMNSPGHKSNILSPDFKTIGVSVYEKDGRYYFVQLFGFKKNILSEQ